MSESKIEEIVMMLSVIASILAYQNGLLLTSLVFFGKGVMDFLCVIRYALKEIEAEKLKSFNSY